MRFGVNGNTKKHFKLERDFSFIIAFESLTLLAFSLPKLY